MPLFKAAAVQRAPRVAQQSCFSYDDHVVTPRGVKRLGSAWLVEARKREFESSQAIPDIWHSCALRACKDNSFWPRAQGCKFPILHCNFGNLLHPILGEVAFS